jgi:uncharacterized protein (DUF885 family)
MHLDRRQVLAASAAAVAAPAVAYAQATPGAAGGEAGHLNALLEAFFQENLRHSPEFATNLGLDKGANADLRFKLSDSSPAARAAEKARTLDNIRRLKGLDRKALSGMDAVNFDTVLYTQEIRASVQAFDFGGSSYGPSPYAISQLTGAYQSVPDFLDTKHGIETKLDADAYLARLDAFAERLDQDTAQFRHDVALGVAPPDFLLDTTLVQLEATRRPADEAGVVQSLAKRAAAKGLGEGYGATAAKLYQDKVVPALTRQIEAVRAVRAKAGHEAGVWNCKDGDAFYAAALRFTTTTKMTPQEVHQLGLDQAKDILARLDGILRAQGLTQGTVGERIRGLYKDPKQFFPNTPQGKTELIAYCNDRLAAIRPRLGRVFKRLPTYQFEVRAVPPAIDAGAPLAYSQGPSADGSRPGLVYFNLHDTAEWPRWNLPSTVFHEGLPGHQLEGALALQNASLPMLRKTSGFSGYAEGWALYAEQLADELGMYDDDPLGRIGYLKAQLFRAGRCVVDTGMHHLHWSKERAVTYLTGLDGDAVGSTTREIERYCATPAQACSYKIGHTVWTSLRARAMAELGPRYDIKDFHAAGLDCGRTPLEVLDRVIGDYIASMKRA